MIHLFLRRCTRPGQLPREVLAMNAESHVLLHIQQRRPVQSPFRVRSSEVRASGLHLRGSGWLVCLASLLLDRVREGPVLRNLEIHGEVARHVDAELAIRWVEADVWHFPAFELFVKRVEPGLLWIQSGLLLCVVRPPGVLVEAEQRREVERLALLVRDVLGDLLQRGR